MSGKIPFAVSKVLHLVFFRDGQGVDYPVLQQSLSPRSGLQQENGKIMQKRRILHLFIKIRKD
jgi:hypothetical protein